ncbi:MAG TPA: hypothetical protein VFO36_10440, partial [Nitrospiraceae bacterium]|nr:hypothetical protein [Nitrospiraceae bacterium]
ALEEMEIDLQWEGRRCRIGQLNAKDSRAVIAKMLGIIGKGFREVGGHGLDETVETIVAGTALQSLDAVTLDWLTDMFVKVTYIESEAGTERWLSPREVIDLAFGGGEGSARWGRWLAACVRWSCGPFFVAALDEAKKLQRAQTPSPITSPKTGFSTESPSQGAIRGTA